MSENSNEVIDLTSPTAEEQLRNPRNVRARRRSQNAATAALRRIPQRSIRRDRIRRHAPAQRYVFNHVNGSNFDHDEIERRIAILFERHQLLHNQNNGLDRAAINNLSTTRVGEEYTDIIDLTETSNRVNEVIDLTSNDIQKAIFKPKYKVIREKKSDPTVKQDDTCTICLEDFEAKQECIVLRCKHAFHKKCVKNWLLQNNSCPLCRQPAS